MVICRCRRGSVSHHIALAGRYCTIIQESSELAVARVRCTNSARIRGFRGVWIHPLLHLFSVIFPPKNRRERPTDRLYRRFVPFIFSFLSIETFFFGIFKLPLYRSIQPRVTFTGHRVIFERSSFFQKSIFQRKKVINESRFKFTLNANSIM